MAVAAKNPPAGYVSKINAKWINAFNQNTSTNNKFDAHLPGYIDIMYDVSDKNIFTFICSFKNMAWKKDAIETEKDLSDIDVIRKFKKFVEADSARLNKLERWLDKWTLIGQPYTASGFPCIFIRAVLRDDRMGMTPHLCFMDFVDVFFNFIQQELSQNMVIEEIDEMANISYRITFT